MSEVLAGAVPCTPPPALARALREAVRELGHSEPRRRHPPLLHVGVPGAATSVLPGEHRRLDPALAADQLVRLLTHHAQDDPLVWLTRPGPLEVQDVDAFWVAAALTAAAETGLELRLVVVNRHGWRDPRSGATRSWRRLR